jgi:hypothetical protein
MTTHYNRFAVRGEVMAEGGQGIIGLVIAGFVMTAGPKWGLCSFQHTLISSSDPQYRRKYGVFETKTGVIAVST